MHLDQSKAACDYTSLNTDLNTCVAAASGSTDTKWFFPYGTLGQQSDFCTSSAQTTLQTCVNTIFANCKQDAKSVKMFSESGDNLLNAYTNLCGSTLVDAAQACMSVVTSAHQATFTTAETAFGLGVVALPTAASFIEICGLATTMKYTAYTTILPTYCTDSDHLAVWSSFYDTVLNTYACASCVTASSGTSVTNSLWLMSLSVCLIILTTSFQD
ncbi:uncharacterized protein LOC128221153 [Mya arenaria]|nr:uncharacterized protein LOC128221153 [Mya arenaria]